MEQMESGSRGADHSDKQVAIQDTAISQNNFHHDSDPTAGERGTGTPGRIQTSTGHDPEQPGLTLSLAFWKERAGPRDLHPDPSNLHHSAIQFMLQTH